MKKSIHLRIKEILSKNKNPNKKFLILNFTHWDNIINEDEFSGECSTTFLKYERKNESIKDFIENLDDEKFDLIFLQFPLGFRDGRKDECDYIHALINKNLNDKGCLLNISILSSFSGKHEFLSGDTYIRHRENVIGEIYKPETGVRISMYEFLKGPFAKDDVNFGKIYCSDFRDFDEQQNNLNHIKVFSTSRAIFSSAIVTFGQDRQINNFKTKNLIPVSIQETQLERVSVDLLKSNKNRNKVLDKIKYYKNGVFIPMIPSKSNKCEILIENLKDSRYWLVTFDPEMFLNDYVMNFLNSDDGKEQLLSLGVGNIIPHLNSLSLGKIILPMKNTEQQEKIVKNRKKIEDAQKIFNEYIKKVSENVEDDDFEFKPEELMEQVPGYSTDKLIKEEESRNFERKSTLRFDLKQNKIQDYITEQVLKTIVAFLNTDGGTLVVGQSDDKQLVGIEADKFKNQDECSKFLKDKIKSRIGIKFLETYIKYEFIKHDGKTLIVITCTKLPASERAFVNENEFWIRTGPGNQQLNIKETIEYIETKSKI